MMIQHYKNNSKSDQFALALNSERNVGLNGAQEAIPAPKLKVYSQVFDLQETN